MKKQDQIDELKKALADETALSNLYKRAVENDRKQREAVAKLHVLTAERDTIAQIRSGSVPIEVLREALTSGHEVVGQGLGMVTTFHLQARDQKPIEKALAEALLAPAKPKFATGGIITLSPHDRDLLRRINNGNSRLLNRGGHIVDESNYYFNGGTTA